MLQTWENIISVPYDSDGAALTSSTSLTDISPTPISVLPLNFLNTPGQRLRVTASGRFSTTGTPTLVLGVYWGGVAGVDIVSNTITTASSVTNLTWYLEAILQLRSIGSSGTILGTGYVMGVSAATAVNLLPASAPAVATINTTSANAITIGAQWSASSASNTVTCHEFTIESTL